VYDFFDLRGRMDLYFHCKKGGLPVSSDADGAGARLKKKGRTS